MLELKAKQLGLNYFWLLSFARTFRENGLTTHGRTSLSVVYSSFGTMEEESSRANDINSVCYMTYVFKIEHA